MSGINDIGIFIEHLNMSFVKSKTRKESIESRGRANQSQDVQTKLKSYENMVTGKEFLWKEPSDNLYCILSAIAATFR